MTCSQVHRRRALQRCSLMREGSDFEARREGFCTRGLRHDTFLHGCLCSYVHGYDSYAVFLYHPSIVLSSHLHTSAGRGGEGRKNPRGEAITLLKISHFRPLFLFSPRMVLLSFLCEWLSPDVARRRAVPLQWDYGWRLFRSVKGSDSDGAR